MDCGLLAEWGFVIGFVIGWSSGRRNGELDRQCVEKMSDAFGLVFACRTSLNQVHSIRPTIHTSPILAPVSRSLVSTLLATSSVKSLTLPVRLGSSRLSRHQAYSSSALMSLPARSPLPASPTLAELASPEFLKSRSKRVCAVSPLSALKTAMWTVPTILLLGPVAALSQRLLSSSRAPPAMPDDAPSEWSSLSPPSASEREYDIVIAGATGFTGKLVLEVRRRRQRTYNPTPTHTHTYSPTRILPSPPPRTRVQFYLTQYPNLKIAVAGRNASKLADVVSSVKEVRSSERKPLAANSGSRSPQIREAFRRKLTPAMAFTHQHLLLCYSLRSSHSLVVVADIEVLCRSSHHCGRRLRLGGQLQGG